MTSNGRVDTYFVVAAKWNELAQLTNDTQTSSPFSTSTRAWFALAEQGTNRPRMASSTP